MLFRYSFIAFLITISYFLISAGFSTPKVDISEYDPTVEYSGGPAAVGGFDRTGSPLSSGSTCTQCHSGGAGTTTVTITVLEGSTPVSSYIAGNNYTVRYTVANPSFSLFGFQGVALTSTNAGAGIFSAPVANTQLSTIGGVTYIEQGGGASASPVFEVTWTAPSTNTGNVVFYGMGNAVNGAGTGGDRPSSPETFTLTELIPTTISYPGTPYCANASDPSPVVNGQSGGTFSSTAGLVINASSGVIDVSASTPATYVVTYTYSTGSTTFNVTVKPTYSSSFNASICANETFNFGSQVLDGSDAGFHVETFQAANGCDSMVTLTLFVQPIYEQTDTASICPGGTYDFIGNILTDVDAGLNTVVLPAMNGCDSTLNVFLIVTSIDNSISEFGGVLTAAQAGATYQWLNCDNGNFAIAGATNSSFSPVSTGNYAVEITIDGCTSTSNCMQVAVEGIEKLNVNSSIIFPNPVTDVFEIKNKETFGEIESITLVDASGKIVQTISVDDKSTDIRHLDAGVYFLKIVTRSGESIVSLVKK